MQNSTKKIGQKGEKIALDYLLGKGYNFITQNYHYKKAEIDLIFQKEQLLVFVEVKYRSSDAFGMPEEMVSEKQQELIVGAAENYIIENNWENDIRFDIISILAIGKKLSVSHFEDAFF